MVVLALISALLIKHMVADFFLQTAWMIDGKSRYGHVGGIAHAALHGGLTLTILAFVCGPVLAVTLAFAETVVHYHLDWAKARFADQNDLSPDNSAYWRSMGVDQLAHQLTYVVIVAVACA